MGLNILDKKGKRLSDKKFAMMKFSGILIQDVRKYLKSGDKVYFSFFKQPIMGTGLCFSIFNEYTHKANLPIKKFPDYIKEYKVVDELEFYNVYDEMNSKDYDTYTLPD